MLTLLSAAWHDDHMEQTQDEIAARWEATNAFVAMLPLINPQDSTLVTQTMRSFYSLRFYEIASLYKDLDAQSQEFVTDVIAALSQPSTYKLGAKSPEKAATVTIACVVAPIFTARLRQRNTPKVTLSFAEEVGLHISHAYRLRISAINWEDTEFVDYTRGAALIVAAGRKDATDFENVLWLGRNHERLIPLIDRMAEVSAERDYLQTLLDNDSLPLVRGVL
jgi:hypothetical protein